MPEPCNLALKEWAVAVSAFAAGLTICAVRKGGIHEKRFDIPGRRCYLLPTYLHQGVETVQPRFHGLLERVLVQQPLDGRLHLPCFAEISDVVPLDAPENLQDLASHVVWTPAYVEQRFRWRPRQPLQLLLLRVYALPEEYTLPMRPAYAGCSSWVTMETAIEPVRAVPVLDDRQYASARRGVLEAVRAVAAV